MVNFCNQESKKQWTLEKINEVAKSDPEYLINSVEDRFNLSLERVVDYILNEKKESKLILVSGPSSSGKTTFAKIILERLKKKGVKSEVFPFDNFYLGKDKVPILPDGSKDFESIEGLDVKNIKKCLSTLIKTGECIIPTYDFAKMAPAKEKQCLKNPKGGIVLAEGLHAINPILTEGISSEHIVRIYVDICSGIKHKDKVFYPPKFLRLARRVLRDYIYRGTLSLQTLEMWHNILRGEKLYIKPIRRYADIKVSTLHEFEPCVMKTETLKLFEDLPPEIKINFTKFMKHLGAFNDIKKDLVPKNSLIREFI